MVGSVEGKGEIEVIGREVMGGRGGGGGGEGGRGVMASWGASREVGELKREKERKRGSEEKVCVWGWGVGGGV